jgi:hypothetical protein
MESRARVASLEAALREIGDNQARGWFGMDDMRAFARAALSESEATPDPIITQGMERLAEAQKSVQLTQPSVFGEQWAEAKASVRLDGETQAVEAAPTTDEHGERA